MSGALFGPSDANLRAIREALNVQMFARGQTVKITGLAKNVSKAAGVLSALQRMMRGKDSLPAKAVAQAITTVAAEVGAEGKPGAIDVYTGRTIEPRSPGQKRYLEAIHKHDMVFCLGPAGTGKTYLAVAQAVHMLKTGAARRMILTRPAVEAGEKLGYLPGDMQAKVNPYLRPLFDALHDMMDF